MTARRSVLLQLFALAVAVAMSFAALPLFRSAAPSYAGLLLSPMMILGMLVGTFGVIRGPHVPAIGLYRAFALASGIYVVEQTGLLGAGLLGGVFTFRLLFAVAFGVFVGIAPVMRRVEQNPWFGVRTPWTLGSRRVWRETHRVTALLWTLGGLFGAILALIAPLTVTIAYLVVLMLSPVGVSYAVWRRMGRP